MGAALGWHPGQILGATLPELLLAIRGWRLARGLGPAIAPMTKNRLTELVEKYG